MRSRLRVANRSAWMSEAGPAITRIPRSQSLAEVAFGQIRDLIITDKLQLGQQLSESRLAEQLGISRTPVRDALLRLAAERLVSVRPQHGTFVLQFDATQLRDLAGLREVLEVGAAKAAVRIDRKALLLRLSAVLQEGRAALDRGPVDYQAADAEFHRVLIEASGNAEIVGAYAQIAARISAIRFRLTSTNERVRESQEAHEAITAAIAEGDEPKAEALLGHHVTMATRIFEQSTAESEGRVPDEER